MTKKLFVVCIAYGQYVVVASSKEEAYELFCPKDEEGFYSYHGVDMDSIHEVEGYKVEGETSVIGGYAE